MMGSMDLVEIAKGIPSAVKAGQATGKYARALESKWGEGQSAAVEIAQGHPITGAGFATKGKRAKQAVNQILSSQSTKVSREGARNKLRVRVRDRQILKLRAQQRQAPSAVPTPPPAPVAPPAPPSAAPAPTPAQAPPDMRWRADYLERRMQVKERGGSPERQRASANRARQQQKYAAGRLGPNAKVHDPDELEARMQAKERAQERRKKLRRAAPQIAGGVAAASAAAGGAVAARRNLRHVALRKPAEGLTNSQKALVGAGTGAAGAMLLHERSSRR